MQSGHWRKKTREFFLETWFYSFEHGRADERAVFLCDEKPYQSIGKADADNQ